MADSKSGTIGLYFSFDQASANALRGRLNQIAARYGYTATRGATAGQGNLSEFLCAIDAGEIATIFMSDEIKSLIPWLDTQQQTCDDQRIGEALCLLQKQLIEALDREEESDAEDVISFFLPKGKRDIALQMIERGVKLLKEAESECGG